MNKKYLVISTFLYFTIFTFAPMESATICRRKPVEDEYNNAINQLQKHLEETSLTVMDRNNLINKLKGYFCPDRPHTDIFLKNPTAAQMYSSIIKSYNQLLQAQKSNAKNNGVARKFAEHAVGKIILFCSPRKK